MSPGSSWWAVSDCSRFVQAAAVTGQHSHTHTSDSLNPDSSSGTFPLDRGDMGTTQPVLGGTWAPLSLSFTGTSVGWGRRAEQWLNCAVELWADLQSFQCVTAQLFKWELGHNHFSLWELCLASVWILCPFQRISSAAQDPIPAGSALAGLIQQQCRTWDHSSISWCCGTLCPHMAPGAVSLINAATSKEVHSQVCKCGWRWKTAPQHPTCEKLCLPLSAPTSAIVIEGMKDNN